jgi:ribosomal protein S18 acetylase RimI-like enzyme
VNSFVLNLNGIIVAYGEIWIDDEEIEIARLLVNPMHRCEGFGRLLAQHLLRKARSICTNIWLRVHPQNKAALALYSKLGFTRTSVEQEACFNVNHPLQYVWMSAE